jgi:hypothetical protein
LATTAKQSCFEEVALLAQETAVTEEEGETQAMLFALLQEQHNKQMETMATANKTNVDAMMEQMNALVATAGGNQNNDKENTPPARNSTPTNDGTKKPKRKKKICPNCKTFVYHSLDKCYELEENKDTRYPGWKSVHTAV